MKQDKVCISKKVGYFSLFVLLLTIGIFAMSQAASTQKSTSSRAGFKNAKPPVKNQTGNRAPVAGFVSCTNNPLAGSSYNASNDVCGSNNIFDPCPSSIGGISDQSDIINKACGPLQYCCRKGAISDLGNGHCNSLAQSEKRAGYCAESLLSQTGYSERGDKKCLLKKTELGVQILAPGSCYFSDVTIEPGKTAPPKPLPVSNTCCGNECVNCNKIWKDDPNKINTPPTTNIDLAKKVSCAKLGGGDDAICVLPPASDGKCADVRSFTGATCYVRNSTEPVGVIGSTATACLTKKKALNLGLGKDGKNEDGRTKCFSN